MGKSYCASGGLSNHRPRNVLRMGFPNFLLRLRQSTSYEKVNARFRTNRKLYPVHVTTRKSFGLMTRKLSVTESHRIAQFRGTFSRRKPSVASANWAQVA